MGTALVVRAAYPDPEVAGTRGWWWSTSTPAGRLARPVTLAEIKQLAAFADSPLLRQGRLSVVPLTKEQWNALTRIDTEEIERGRRGRPVHAWPAEDDGAHFAAMPGARRASWPASNVVHDDLVAAHTDAAPRGAPGARPLAARAVCDHEEQFVVSVSTARPSTE